VTLRSQENSIPGDGFAAMGKPIPTKRRDAAYQWAKENGAERAVAFSMVERVAACLERDHPHEALEEAQKTMGATGAYVVLSYLLTGPVS
jgi:hypothetical protein